MDKISLYIVEDYLLTRIAYKHSLANAEEFEVAGDFETAEACLEMMKKRTVDVVLMDLGLPYMNGIEATKRIKSKYPDTKVIVFTSHDNEDKILASLSSGANGYALKDIDFEALKEVIKSVHFGAFWFDPQVAKIALDALPKPISTDFNNLYESKKMEHNLTQRELEVLKLLIDGKSNTEIAKEIIVSTNTAKAHVGNILSKLCVSDRVQAAVKAVRANLF